MIRTIFTIVILFCIGFAGWYFWPRHSRANVTTEVSQELAAVPLKIEGKVPDWLKGTLVRNGAVSVSIDGQKIASPFDGLAMLHAFAIGDGKVLYTNRFLRTSAYRQVFDEGSLSYAAFASDPHRSFFGRFLSFLQPHSDGGAANPNVNITFLSDRYVALTETPLPVRFDVKTLNTLGALHFQDGLPQSDCFESAHPHRDISTGDLINYIVEYGETSHYIVYGIGDGEEGRETIAKIPVDMPAYMHSFSLTEHYIVFTEYPLLVNPIDFLLSDKAFIHNFHWQPEKGTRFLIIDRSTGQPVGNFRTDAFFSWHHANAYEKEDNIILDLVHYPQPDFDEKVTVPQKLTRYHVSLGKGTIRSEVLFDKDNVEFPRINEALVEGRPYRYVYLRGGDSLYKVDVDTKKALTWTQAGTKAGEPVFVAAPQATREDEGVILAIIQDSKAAYLVILDATTFKELARAKTPIPMPAFELHGQFYGK